MTKDRLNDLRNFNGNVVYDANQVNISIPGESDENSFFDESNRIREDVDTLRRYIDMVERMQNRIINATGEEENHLRNELDDQMDKTKTLITKIRRDLKTMAQRINQKQATSSPTEMRIAKSQFTSLSTIFTEHSKKYNQIQTAYFENSKKRFQRQLEISGVRKTDDEINEMIHSGSVQVFTQGILAETKMARQTLADVEQRHRDIVKLEKDILELQEMFVDFAALIEDQGQMINRIEDNMVKADEAVEVGVQELPQAVKNKRAARKKKWIVIGIVALIIIIIVILLAILLSQYLPKNRN